MEVPETKDVRTVLLWEPNLIKNVLVLSTILVRFKNATKIISLINTIVNANANPKNAMAILSLTEVVVIVNVESNLVLETLNLIPVPVNASVICMLLKDLQWIPEPVPLFVFVNVPWDLI